MESRYRRIRLVKKLMRPMPRKSNLHRYPILKYFAPTARKRSYLWEFRRRNVVAALWIGWLVALVPIYSIQMVSAFILCIPLKGNCLVAMALQWITNPVSIPFILVAQYTIGDFIIRLFGAGSLDMNLASVLYSEGIESAMQKLANWDAILHVAFSIFSGGLVISVAGAAFSTWLYLAMAGGKTSVSGAAK